MDSRRFRRPIKTICNEQENAQKSLDIILNYSKKSNKHEDYVAHPQTMLKDDLKRDFGCKTDDVHRQDRTTIVKRIDEDYRQSLGSIKSIKSSEINDFINKYICFDNSNEDSNTNTITLNPNEYVRLKAGGSVVSKLIGNDCPDREYENREQHVCPKINKNSEPSTIGSKGENSNRTANSEEARLPHNIYRTRILDENSEPREKVKTSTNYNQRLLGESLEPRQNVTIENRGSNNPKVERKNSESYLSFGPLRSLLKTRVSDSDRRGPSGQTIDSSEMKHISFATNNTESNNPPEETIDPESTLPFDPSRRFQKTRGLDNDRGGLSNQNIDPSEMKHISFASEPQSFEIVDDNMYLGSNDEVDDDIKGSDKRSSPRCATANRPKMNILEFDRIFKAELKKRHGGISNFTHSVKITPDTINNIQLEPSSSVKSALIHSAVTGLPNDIPLTEDYELMNAIDKFIQADNACKFEEALKAAEIAAKMAPAGYEEEAAASAARFYQYQFDQRDNLNSILLDGKKKPIEIVAYLGSTNSR